MHKPTLKVEDSSTASCDALPMNPHCAIICGATGCGKTEFVLGLLQHRYRGHFEHIVIICPTWKDNDTYKRGWLLRDPEIYLIDPVDRNADSGENRLHDWLTHCHKLFSGEKTLYIIDDCASSKVLNVKRDKFTDLAFSGRHTSQSVWVLSQSYKSVLKDFRKQTKWTALFYCKDRDSFDECLRENDVIPDGCRAQVKEILAKTSHTAVVRITEQLTSYFIAN